MESYLTPIWYWMCLLAKLKLISECAVLQCGCSLIKTSMQSFGTSLNYQISALLLPFQNKGHRLQDLWFLEKNYKMLLCNVKTF